MRSLAELTLLQVMACMIASVPASGVSQLADRGDRRLDKEACRDQQYTIRHA